MYSVSMGFNKKGDGIEVKAWCPGGKKLAGIKAIEKELNRLARKVDELEGKIEELEDQEIPDRENSA